MPDDPTAGNPPLPPGVPPADPPAAPSPASSADSPDTSQKMIKADWLFVIGLASTFLMGIACMVLNFIRAGSVPSEPIWAFAAVVLGHKVSSDKFGT